jgi:hypothetical protein
VLRVKAAIADIFAALAAWPEAAAAHETVLQARPGHVTSLMGKAAAAATRGDYASVGEAVELAQVYGLRLYLAPSDIKVAFFFFELSQLHGLRPCVASLTLNPKP